MRNIYNKKIREQIEREFAGDVAKFLASQKRRIIDAILAGQDIDWNIENDKLYKSIYGQAYERAMEAAELMLAKMPAGVEIVTVQEAALGWLQTYKFQIREITNRSEKLVRKAVAEFIQTPGFTRGDLEAMIVNSFGPVRASTIAVTETTRAFAQGELLVADEYRKIGIRMMDIWNTDNDDLVCELCAPLNDKSVPHGTAFYPPDGLGDGYPPRHPNCRCGMSHEVDRG